MESDMLHVMDQRWRHVLRGYLSVFNLPPVPARRIEVRALRKQRNPFDGPFVKVGEYLRFALGQVNDEAGAPAKPGEQQPPRRA
jgi:hypothetical protein